MAGSIEGSRSPSPVNDGSTTPTSSQQVGRVDFAHRGQPPIVSQDQLEAGHRAGFAPLRVASRGEASNRSMMGEDPHRGTSPAPLSRQRSRHMHIRIPGVHVYNRNHPNNQVNLPAGSGNPTLTIGSTDIYLGRRPQPATGVTPASRPLRGPLPPPIEQPSAATTSEVGSTNLHSPLEVFARDYFAKGVSLPVLTHFSPEFSAAYPQVRAKSKVGFLAESPDGKIRRFPNDEGTMSFMSFSANGPEMMGSGLERQLGWIYDSHRDHVRETIRRISLGSHDTDHHVQRAGGRGPVHQGQRSCLSSGRWQMDDSAARAPSLHGSRRGNAIGGGQVCR